VEQAKRVEGKVNFPGRQRDFYQISGSSYPILCNELFPASKSINQGDRSPYSQILVGSRRKQREDAMAALTYFM
jgi:hypothetical protein